MDNDELKDAIEGTLEHTCCENFETQATSILSLIAPELEKAEKWDKLTDDQCNKFLMLLMKDTQSPSFVCPECEYIDWSPIDHLANPLVVIRWMEKEMPRVFEDYCIESRYDNVVKNYISETHIFLFILDLRNLVQYLVEHPEWGEKECPDLSLLGYCMDYCDEKKCNGSGKVIHPALGYYLETKGEK